MTGISTPAAQGKRANAPKRPKHVPQRTCVACHQVKPKRELLRIVRTPLGRVEMDPTGKKSGRGAYLCANRSCWNTALKKRLEQELETTLSQEDRVALEEYAATLPPSEPLPRVGAAVSERAL